MNANNQFWKTERRGGRGMGVRLCGFAVRQRELGLIVEPA
jgi:hypothetical protein